MKAAGNLLWALFAVLGALALAHVTGAMNPNEKSEWPLAGRGGCL